MTLAALILVSACDDKAKESTRSSAPAAAPQGGSLPDHGLLLPRDQRLMIRDMQDGREIVAKRPAPDVYFSYPRWSPDGRQFAYVLDIQFTGMPNQNWGSDIAVSPLDGSGERVVLKRPGPGFQVNGLEWSPDGTALYAGVMETEIKDGRLLGQTQRLERIDLADGARSVIVPDGAQPAMARDGSRIAYVTFAAGDDPGGLWIARPDGSERRLILPATGRFVAVTQPRFSPDGTSIAFAAATLTSGAEAQPTGRSAHRWPWQPRIAAAHGLPMDIWTIPAAGGEPRRLTNLAEDEPSVAWSPDGTQLAIVASGGLYQMSVMGGEPRKIGLGGSMVQIDWR